MSERAGEQNLYTQVRDFLNSWLFFSFSDKLKFSIKVSLALTLAYMIPMSMGWAQPTTAAITVMLIATSGSVSESVMKGLLRIIGTVIGAVIGLVLIALFPQERMVYLLLVSVIVTFVLYMHQVYQGDSTAFMLMALIIMMVFQGGNADDAFLYGIDRTYMTLFGIVIYTLVGLFVWPVKQEDTTVEDALELTQLQQELFTKTMYGEVDSGDERLLLKMAESEQRLQSAYVEASGTTLSMALNLSTWESISKLYSRLSALLMILSVHNEETKCVIYKDHIDGYEDYLREIDALFSACKLAWQEQRLITLPPKRQMHFEGSTLSNLDHAAVVTHVETVHKLHKSLRILAMHLNALQGEKVSIEVVDESIKAEPRFVWLDPEYLKGALQTFLVFWFSTLMWIYLNPPGGFMMVTLATLLSVMTSFSVLKPSVLTVLFSFSFIFATGMYVFVLSHLVYGWELALFIFFYTFIAFYFINPKISIFFLLGIFTLGIDNDMHYNFALFLNILLLFYLFLAILMLFYYLPFSTKAEHLFLVMRRRLFHHAAALLQEHTPMSELPWLQQKRHIYHREHLVRTAQKLKLWASQVDVTYFKTNSSEALEVYVNACEAFSSKLELLVQYEERLADNPLYKRLESVREHNVLNTLTDAMGKEHMSKEVEALFDESEQVIVRVEEKINALKDELKTEVYRADALTAVYITLSMRHSVWIALQRCYESSRDVDFEDLKMSRF